MAQEQLEDATVQKKGFVDKLYETVDEKEHRHRTFSTHAFTLLRVNKPRIHWYRYYAIRRLRSNMAKAIKKFRAQHPDSVIIYQNNNIPSAVNVYQRLKASDKIYYHGNEFQPLVTESELIAWVYVLCTIVKPERAIVPFPSTN